jgi:cytochrome c oxidase cbb3-type subunit 4
MAFLNGLVTIISMAVFLGIVWWAWSKGRVKANEEAAQLPFSLPDEEDSDLKNREVKS